MTEPAVQYTTTPDGISIAWAEAGQGPAMLFCTFSPFSHVRDQFTVYRDVLEAFAQSFRVITFDARGTGMSERDVDSVSADTHFADARAVLDAAKVERAVVNVDGTSILATSTGLRLAISCPQQITHVVLEAPFVSVGDLADTPFGRTGLALAELDWAVYTQALFRILLGISSPEMIESYSTLAGGWVDPSVGLKYIREWEALDLSDILPKVRQPTLVTRNDPCCVPVRCCERVAAKIPRARFRQWSDPTYAGMADLIREFTGQDSDRSMREPQAEKPTGVHAALQDHATAVILFADIVDSTALTERLGDAAFRDKARELDAGLRTLIRDSGGTPSKASFSATECWPSSPARDRPLRWHWLAGRLAMRVVCRCTSGYTPAT